MTLITFPWPAKELSPNARLHWAVKGRHVKTARYLASWVARAEGVSAPHDGPIPLTITFRPPDKRRRDRDNMIASCKAMMDGLADAMGVDDSRFETSYRWGWAVKGGAVEVLI